VCSWRHCTRDHSRADPARGTPLRQPARRPLGDATLTFSEVDELSSRIAHVLRSRRIERVGLLLGNGLLSVYDGRLEAEFERGLTVMDEARRGAERF